MAKQNDGPITPLRRFIIVTAISLGGVMGIVATATVLAATPRQEPQPNQTNQTNIATTARAQILHLAPFTGTLSSTAVTVVISNAINTVSLTDVVFGQTSNGYLDIEADIPTQIEIIPSGETTPVLTSILTLTAGVDYSIAAVGGSHGYPLELLTLIDDNTAPPPGSSKVRAVHAAPFTDTLAGTRVDIRHDDGMLLDNFDDIEYLSATTYITLPTGSYDLHLSDATSTTSLFDLPTLPLTEGQIATVYALGDIANQPLDVLVISSTTSVSAFAQVQFAHFAPFTSVLTSTAVNVILNNPMTTTMISDVMYGQTSNGYLDLAAGLPTDIQVIPTGSVTPAISTTLVFSPDVHYTLAAIGNGADQPFDLLVITDDLSAPMTDTFKLRVVHVAPFSNTITGTLLDVRDQSGTLLDSLGDLTYESVSTYLTLPVSTLDLQLTQPGGSPTLYDIPPLSFNGGQVATLFAIGDNQNQPLGTLVITNRQGTFRYILPLVYKEVAALR